MNIEELRDYCLDKPAVTESFPFDNQTLVFKVAGKMFALVNIDNFESVNLKCNPEKAVELREQFMAVQPGYHMNKTHWNTVYVHQDLDAAAIFRLIDHSYELIVKSLPKKMRQANNLLP